MALATTYEIRIPKDSTAEVETAGLLGETYLSIDTTQASGAPVENYGYLKSKPTKKTPSLADQLKSFSDQLKAADVLAHLIRELKETEKEVPKANTPPSIPHNPSK
jgi:ABC-type transporter Mla subunit MlaD